MDVVAVVISGNFVVVDEEDAHFLNEYHWWCEKIGHVTYVKTQVKRKTIYLHRLISKPPKGKEVDHVNGDGCDERKCNLRNVSRRENSLNQHNTTNNTGVTGIHKDMCGSFVVTCDRQQFKTKSWVEAKTWLELLKRNDRKEWIRFICKITKNRQSRKGKPLYPDIKQKVIVEYQNKKVTTRDLAQKYGVGKSTIAVWVKGGIL